MKYFYVYIEITYLIELVHLAFAVNAMSADLGEPLAEKSFPGLLPLVVDATGSGLPDFVGLWNVAPQALAQRPHRLHMLYVVCVWVIAY